ncbi:hypothetical protein CPB85DRAFT_1258761 [Mucidula mucida]|nr:hypothetical protein CPB85DRAFT_1258761 [Mucidula mucida]
MTEMIRHWSFNLVGEMTFGQSTRIKMMDEGDPDNIAESVQDGTAAFEIVGYDRHDSPDLLGEMTLGSQTVLHVSAQHSGERPEWDCSIQNFMHLVFVGRHFGRKTSRDTFTAIIPFWQGGCSINRSYYQTGRLRCQQASYTAIHFVSSISKVLRGLTFHPSFVMSVSRSKIYTKEERLASSLFRVWKSRLEQDRLRCSMFKDLMWQIEVVPRSVQGSICKVYSNPPTKSGPEEVKKTRRWEGGGKAEGVG